MVTTTTTYSLKKPTVGQDEDLWGGYLNDSMDLIDDVLDGTTPVTGIDINSGTLDNVTINSSAIGGTTAAAGTFTTLSATTSLGVTGNITVSGTVDGRDIAADGTKLDGIESGATADQTKADIDALGIAASTAATLATARNIALTGAVTGNVNFDGSGNVSIATTATSDPTLTLNGDVSGSATFTNLGNATLTVTVADDSHNHVISNVDGLQTALDGKVQKGVGYEWTATGTNALSFRSADVLETATGGQAALEIYQDTANADAFMQFHVGGDYAAYFGLKGDINDFAVGGWSMGANYYRVWHAGNDGAGSGLDADLWDGNQFSSYLNQAVLTSSSPTFNNAYISGNVYHNGDSDTYVGFVTNGINVVTGGTTTGFNSSGIFLQDGSVHEDYDALSGTTPTINVNSGGAFSLTMSGNTTFTFSSGSSGYSEGFVLQLTGNGSTVTWPASVDWAGGTAPDAPASGETDILVFWTRDGGTTWYGVQSIDAAS